MKLIRRKEENSELGKASRWTNTWFCLEVEEIRASHIYTVFTIAP